MLRYELKKVFSKFKNRMAVALLFVLLVVVSLLTMNRVYYTKEDGNHISGFSAAKSLREDQNKWKGYLTDQVFQEVLEENTYYATDGLTPQEVTQVYEKRVALLREWLDSGEERFSDAQKDFLITRYENLDTPFYYEYVEGWSALLQSISTYLLILALVIGFLVSGIFSDEFLTKADSIFFSSKLGRNRAIVSKLWAGFLITTGIYVVFAALYTFIVLSLLGGDGAGCPIQLDLWRSVYNITFFQAYLFIVAGGYVGALFAALLSMIVSAATHSTATATMVPFIVLCAFPFLSRIITLPEICSFFPDQLLDVYNSVKEFDLVEIGGKVMGVVEVIIPVYFLACLVLQPLLYRVYKRAEIK